VLANLRITHLLRLRVGLPQPSDERLLQFFFPSFFLSFLLSFCFFLWSRTTNLDVRRAVVGVGTGVVDQQRVAARPRAEDLKTKVHGGRKSVPEEEEERRPHHNEARMVVAARCRVPRRLHPQGEEARTHHRKHRADAAHHPRACLESRNEPLTDTTNLQVHPHFTFTGSVAVQ
jgi:hypothetical protein